jgi:hypothetical protein
VRASAPARMPRPTSVLRGAFGTGKCGGLGRFPRDLPAACRAMDHLRPPVRYQGQRLQLGLLLAASSSGSPRIIPAAAGCKRVLAVRSAVRGGSARSSSRRVRGVGTWAS